MKATDLVIGEEYVISNGNHVIVRGIGTHKEDRYSWGSLDRVYKTERATRSDILVDMLDTYGSRSQPRVVKTSQILGTVKDVRAERAAERKAKEKAQRAKAHDDDRKYARAKRLAKSLGVGEYDVRVGIGYDTYNLSGDAVKAIEALLKGDA